MDGVTTVSTVESSVEKLRSAVSAAIGESYEPRHIRRIEDVERSRLQQIYEEVRKDSVIPIIYEHKENTVAAGFLEEILKRTSRRLAVQEITKQQNIEAIIDKAYEELKNVKSENDATISPDWMSCFLNLVENISNEESQSIWGHILAEEVKTPGSYSYRTLERLKNMTWQEILTFQRVAALAMKCDKISFLLANSEMYKKYHVTDEDLMILEDCGLLSLRENSTTIVLKKGNSGAIYNKKIIGWIKPKKNEEAEIVMGVFTFTKSGAELVEGIGNPCNPKYIMDCLKSLHRYHSDVEISAHKLDKIVNDHCFEFDIDEDLLPAFED